MWRSWNEAVIWEKDDEEAQSLPRGGHISTDTKGQMSQDFLDVNSAAAGTLWEGKGWVHLWKMTATTTEAGHPYPPPKALAQGCESPFQPFLHPLQQ